MSIAILIKMRKIMLEERDAFIIRRICFIQIYGWKDSESIFAQHNIEALWLLIKNINPEVERTRRSTMVKVDQSL